MWLSEYEYIYNLKEYVYFEQVEHILYTNLLRFTQDEKSKVIKVDGINKYFKVITYTFVMIKT